MIFIKLFEEKLESTEIVTTYTAQFIVYHSFSCFQLKHIQNANYSHGQTHIKIGVLFDEPFLLLFICN